MRLLVTAISVATRPKIEIQNPPRSQTMPRHHDPGSPRFHAETKFQDPSSPRIHAKSKCQDPRFPKIPCQKRFRIQDLHDPIKKIKTVGSKIPRILYKKNIRIQGPQNPSTRQNFQDPRSPGSPEKSENAGSKIPRIPLPS